MSAKSGAAREIQDRFACHVWWATTDALPSHEFPYMSLAERHRLSRYRRAIDRSRYILGTMLLRVAVADSLGGDPSQVRISRACACGAEHGRPRVEGDQQIALSLSHSANTAVVAVSSNGPVGVDLEAKAKDYDSLAAISGVLSDRELKEALSAGMSTAYLLRVWTLKEAVLKAAGVGLRVDPRHVIISGVNRLSVRVDSMPSSLGLPINDLVLRSLKAPPGYVASLAYVGVLRTVIVRQVTNFAEC